MIAQCGMRQSPVFPLLQRGAGNYGEVSLLTLVPGEICSGELRFSMGSASALWEKSFL